MTAPQHVIVGAGQVGSAIFDILDPECILHDPEKGWLAPAQEYDFMHICFPYSERFAAQVQDYQYLFRPMCTVVHSTVPVGTCDSFNAVHSPIRGKHPRLTESIRIFVKYFGGSQAFMASIPFAQRGIQTQIVASSKDTEALKLWDTAQYGLMILLEKEIHRYCEEHGLDFDVVYTQANQTYNAGYAELGMGWVQRPALKHQAGSIGGHCVVPNAELLDSWVSNAIRALSSATFLLE